MGTVTTVGEGTQRVAATDNTNYRFALVSLTSLFFIWGFITCLNDILIPHLKNVFALSYTQAMLIQFCFFGAYFIMSMPAGALVHRVGYKRGLVVGLLIAGLGCLLFYPAAALRVYALFLGALFVLATGITLLQVSANPYVAVLGPVQTASSRLNLSQAFNSLGTTVAPFFGGFLILSAAAAGLDHDTLLTSQELTELRLEEADAVKIPYLLIAATLFALAAIFAKLKLPDLRDKDRNRSVGDTPPNQRSAWQYPHLVLGAIGIFAYVGAEVAIGSFLVNYLGLENIAGFSEAQAANYVAYYWGAAMVGRFIGSALMMRINPAYLLSFNASAAVLLVGLAIMGSGDLAMWAILLVGLCNSIMFPTIFSLALRGLGPQTSQGSGILCLAIVGGAIVPLIQGVLADAIGLQFAFIVPVFCYLYIAFYGFKGSEPRGA